MKKGMRQGKRIGYMVHGVGAPEWKLRNFVYACIERDGILWVIRPNDEPYETLWFTSFMEAKKQLKVLTGRI